MRKPAPKKEEPDPRSILVYASSDYHLDATTFGVPRFDDLFPKVVAHAAAAIQEQADLFVFCGDLCDPDTPGTHRAVQGMSKVVSLLANAGVMTLLIAGNHDTVEDGKGTTTLSGLFGIEQGGALGKMVRVFEKPAALLLKTRHGKVAFVALPYPSLVNHYDPAEFLNELEDAPDGCPTLVAGHLWLEGMHPGSESTDLARGRPVYWPKDVSRDNRLVLGGHYHEPAHVDGIYICGALAPLVAGEDFVPTLIKARANPRNPGSGHGGWTVERLPMPCRPIRVFREDDPIWSLPVSDSMAPLGVQDALVKLFPPPDGGMVARDLEACLRGAGAAHVVVAPMAKGEREILEVSKRDVETDPTVREVVAAMLDTANVEDRDALRAAVEVCLTAEGL